MSQILSETFLSGFMILVQSLSVVFLYCGTSSGASTVTQVSEELQALLMEERKRKRKVSNRESARRSRMRKKKHLDDLTAELTQLREDNHQIIMSLNITMQRYLHVEAENSVLRAQTNELSGRLESLEDIITFLQWKQW
ncbi:hypothetical protein E1A91_A13G034600v1 [Gossypium mustelinum]|uniref:BZIP domain-containing protein n=1 Tax=Gossypium mustelinum TaxID=34275 RepID=A0A5D2WD89_GOSMU|nr:hypothetical protein E1A91_A13G034600v1 [Gossypium mustelinum]